MLFCAAPWPRTGGTWGKGPGVLSVLLTSLAFDYFFLPPKYSFTMQPFAYLQFSAFLEAFPSRLFSWQSTPS